MISYKLPLLNSNSNQVLYTREVKDTDNAEVDTKIVTDKPEKVSLSINYKLHPVNEEWKSTTSHHERKTIAELNSLGRPFGREFRRSRRAFLLFHFDGVENHWEIPAFSSPQGLAHNLRYK
jgi:hypothetical protein